MRQLEMFKTNSFKNSLPITDKNELEVKEEKARTQEQIILEIFANNTALDFTPVQIWMMVGQQWPLTSVRRAITNLDKQGFLYVTGNKKPGLYGELNNCWRFKKQAI